MDEAVAGIVAVVEVLAEVEAETVADAVDLADQEKCTKQLVTTVSKIVKCHLSQLKASQFIAKNVILSIENKSTYF